MTHRAQISTEPSLVNAPTEGHVIRWAAQYDRLMSVFTLGREARFRERIVEAAGVRAGERILDVGCGTGTLALFAADRAGSGGEVVGIDPSAEMIARARSKAGGATGERARMRFEVAGIENLPFDDDSFDVVLSSLMFHHLPANLQREGLAEVRRVLAPGGRLSIVDFPGGGPAVHRLLGKLLRRHSHQNEFRGHRLESVATLARELGFEDVRTTVFRPRFLRHLAARVPASA